MFDTTETVIEFLQAVLPEFSDVASEYGEPGYSTDGDTPLVVLGNYWCRCEKLGGEARELHDIANHYPHAFARLEEQGVELEWLDEWLVHNDKAYRTQGDSYDWQPSYVLTDDGEIITVDDDIDEWIAWAADDASRAIPARAYSGADLIAAGFTEYSSGYESGWHPGQTADPAHVADEIHREHGDDVEIVFALDETSQFYLKFSAYYR